MNEKVMEVLKERLAKLKTQYRSNPTAELRHRIKECERIRDLLKWELSKCLKKA